MRTTKVRKVMLGRLLLGALLGACAWQSAAAWAADAPLLDLDAAGLASGEVSVWTNRGTLGGVLERGADGGPRAAMVDGRAAVEFGEGRWMRSAFAVPETVTGGRAFSVSLWMRATRIHGKGTVVAWASKPSNGVEFGFGRGAEGAAWAGGYRAAYRRVPALNRWQHVVFTYDGDALSVYVNGELDSRHEHQIATKPGEPVFLGAAWDPAKKVAGTGFSGALATLQVWDRALSPREVRNLGGMTEPFAPAPETGALIETRSTVLRWEPGSLDARAFRVQLATNAPPHMQVHEQPSDEPAMHGIFIVRITPEDMTVIQRNLDETWGLVKRKTLRGK